MSEYQEGCQLRFDEIAAVLSLAGKRSVVGFQTEEISRLTPEKIWNACCRLIQERMMTQIGGSFRLSQELVTVMQPVCQAEAVLAVTPASDLLPQIIYYCSGQQAVSMEHTAYGRYTLIPMGKEALASDLQERMELEYPEQDPEQDHEGAALEINVQQTDPREVLIKSSLFVLEQLDTVTGLRKNWLRLVQQGMDLYLQWTRGDSVCCEALSAELLEQLLQSLLRGETP